MRQFPALLSLILFSVTAVAQSPDRAIHQEVVVNAPVERVWDAWTTDEGVRTFFSPAARIELRVDGAYEMFFNPTGAPGSRGGEGNRILAIDDQRMLSVSWNAPPSLPTVRQQRTNVVIRFKEFETGKTRVSLVQSGWGEGEEWNRAFEYFTNAWGSVFALLKYRFEVGPVDWKKPPTLSPATPQVEMTTYYMIFLKKGPNWSPGNSVELEKLQQDHLAHITQLWKQGMAVIARPFIDGGDIRGVVIVKAGSIDEARTMEQSDPAVKAGRLIVEVHPWMAAKGILP